MDQLTKVLWQSIAGFFVLLILSRIMGRKLIAQMTFFDFVIAITIGTITGTFVTTQIQGLWILLSPVILTMIVISTGYLTIKSLPARKLIEGEPVIIIQNGKILEKNMQKIRYNIDNLEMQLRNQSIFDLSEVEFAVLEPHGKLSVLKKSQNLPLTPKDLGKTTKYKGMSTEIIKDGEIIEQNLQQNNLSFSWLYNELRKQKIDDIDNVFLANLNTDGSLYVDVRNDNLNYVQKVED